MKNYYQPKKIGYRLPKAIYAKTIKTVQAYWFYIGLINAISNNSETKLDPERAAVNAAQAREYVEAIEFALENYVPKNYRDIVFRHVADETNYFELAEEYNDEEDIKHNELKKWTQRFIYGCATNLGENYFND